MDFLSAAVVVLASMIFVLSGMMGYLFWQQNRLLQHVQGLAVAVSTVLTPPVVEDTPPEVPVQEEPVKEEDDRVSVDEDDVEVVEGPPVTATIPEKTDVDDLQDKTVKQLQELLTQKGIPYGKRDAKTVLLQLLKATV
jgi:2-hydroxychromene-2-carboxylate isomerase